MIVTRRRRKAFPYRRLILPIVAIALLALALVWGPSRQALTGGPMAPVWSALSTAGNTIAAPFHFAAQNQVITDRNRTIATLQQQLTSAQQSATAKDKQIASLQSQIEQLKLKSVTAHHPGTQPKFATRPAPAGAAGAFASAPTSNATPEMQRTAQYWASMDPQNAAKIAQRLPPSYDAAIFSLMQPDAVGAIMDQLPPTFAAKLAQNTPKARH